MHMQSHEMTVAIECARTAGKTLLSFYEEGYETRSKKDSSPVTDADIASERVILDQLTDAFSYPILSEESGNSADLCSHDYAWFVDPLDGTQDFISKTGSLMP